MLRSVLVLILAAVASPAAALDLPPLCQAMHGLADAARQSGQPQRLAITANGCAPAAGGAPAEAFCTAAGSDPDAFAWDLLRTCLNSLAAEPQVTNGADEVDVGSRRRKRIVHIAARLSGGVRLDLASVTGGYDLVVWRPK